MNFIKRLFNIYSPPSKAKLMANIFHQGLHGYRGDRGF